MESSQTALLPYVVLFLVKRYVLLFIFYYGLYFMSEHIVSRIYLNKIVNFNFEHCKDRTS